MNAELIHDMPFADYLAHPALSATGMRRLLDSPARYVWDRQHPLDTPTLILGRLIHALAFDQPHVFAVKDWDGRTKEGKVRAAEVSEAGLEIVSEDDWATAQGIADALRENQLARSVLYGAGTEHEVSAIWTDEETGVELRCRFDALTTDGRIRDLKSTLYAKPSAFTASAARYGYYMAAAHYRAAVIALGLNPDPEFLLVAVEKAAPHFISVTGMNAPDLDLAERLRRKAIRTYADCLERDEWADYSSEITYPDAPSWWRYSVEEQTEMEMTF